MTSNPPRRFQFSLASVLIVVTALAILFAQRPYVVELGPGYDHAPKGYGIYVLSERFGAVAAFEAALLIGWIFDRLGRFPWRLVLVTAASLQVIVVAFLCWAQFGMGERRAV